MSAHRIVPVGIAPVDKDLERDLITFFAQFQGMCGFGVADISVASSPAMTMANLRARDAAVRRPWEADAATFYRMSREQCRAWWLQRQALMQEP